MKTRDLMDIAVGAGIGAAMMYLFDPDKGPQRREYAADKATAAARDAGETLGAAWVTAQDKAGQVSEEVAHHAQNAYATAKDTTSDWLGRARQVSSRASDAALEFGSGVFKKARYVGAHLADRARDIGSGVVDKARDFRASAADHARDIGSSASGSFGTARKTASRYASQLQNSASNTASRLRGQAEDAVDESSGHWYSSTPGITAVSASAAALASGLVFFLDARSGPARRNYVRAKLSSCITQTGEFIDHAYHNVANRSKGLVSEMRTHLAGKDIEDDTLQQHVKAKMGHLIRQPGPVEVTVQNGVVTLNGPVSYDELEVLTSYVGSMRGVKGVVNQLRGAEVAGEPPRGARGNLARAVEADWTPAARTASGVAGGALAVYGASRRDWVGIGVGIFGLGLLARSASSTSLSTLAHQGKDLASRAAGQATDLTAQAAEKVSDVAGRITGSGGNGKKHTESIPTSMPAAPAETQSMTGLMPQ